MLNRLAIFVLIFWLPTSAVAFGGGFEIHNAKVTIANTSSPRISSAPPLNAAAGEHHSLPANQPPTNSSPSEPCENETVHDDHSQETFFLAPINKLDSLASKNLVDSDITRRPTQSFVNELLRPPRA